MIDERQVEKEEFAAIPLVEERFTVEKREVETGRFRVRVAIDQHEERVTEELSRDEIDIEHVPKNIPLDEIPTVRLEGNTTIIPVVEEQLVVEKRLVLVEEIHLHRRKTSETQEIPVTLRSERAVVERDGVEEEQPAMIRSETANQIEE